MAHIEIRRLRGGGNQMVINGVDVSMEVYRDFEVVEVGDDPEFAEVGLRVTFVLGRLDLDNETAVELTDNVPVVATRVRSMAEVA